MQDSITLIIENANTTVIPYGGTCCYQWVDPNTYERKANSWGWDYLLELCEEYGDGKSVRVSISPFGEMKPLGKIIGNDELFKQLYNGYQYSDAIWTGGTMFKRGDRVRIKSGYNLEGDVYYYVGKNEQDADKVVVAQELELLDDFYSKLDILASAIEPYPYSNEEKVELFIEDLESILDCDKCVLCDEVRNAIAALLTADGVSLTYKPVVAPE